MGHNTAALIRFRHFIDGPLALASLNLACRDHVSAFPQRCRVDPGSLTPSRSQIRTLNSRVIRLVPPNEGCLAVSLLVPFPLASPDTSRRPPSYLVQFRTAVRRRHVRDTRPIADSR